jgi:hypothetical protein
MKKTSLLLTVSCFLVSAHTLAQSSPSGPTAAMTSEIVAMENKIWGYWKARNFDGIESLLAPEMSAVNADGTHDRAKFMSLARKVQCTGLDFKLFNTYVTQLAPNAMLITYRSEASGTCDGQKLDGAADVNSSVWVKRNGNWLGILHHQSPAAKK